MSLLLFLKRGPLKHFVSVKVTFLDYKYPRKIICVLVAQSHPTLCDPMDYNALGSSVHGIFKARILEWVVIPFSRGSSNLETESGSPALQADSSPSEPQKKL